MAANDLAMQGIRASPEEPEHHQLCFWYLSQNIPVGVPDGGSDLPETYTNMHKSINELFQVEKLELYIIISKVSCLSFLVVSVKTPYIQNITIGDTASIPVLPLITLLNVWIVYNWTKWSTLAGGIFKRIFLDENVCIWLRFHLSILPWIQFAISQHWFR